jgi:ubiquinone/menaquinone biosynthesis C-methylase UbiE
MGHYDEYLDRAQWNPSEKLHDWVANRIVSQFDRYSGIQGMSILEIGTGTGRLACTLQRKVDGGGIKALNQIQNWRNFQEHLDCKF